MPSSSRSPDLPEEGAKAGIAPLGGDEVRVYTISHGDRERVRREVVQVLGVLLGVSPTEVVLDRGPKGKPLLQNDPALHFSVSHGQAFSLIGVTRVAPIGVDIERVRAMPQAAAILRRFFTEEEVTAILSDDQRDFRFVQAWTQAEARVKVRGASVWEAATPDPSVTVRELIAPDGYAASVAVAAPEWSVTQMPLPRLE